MAKAPRYDRCRRHCRNTDKGALSKLAWEAPLTGTALEVYGVVERTAGGGSAAAGHLAGCGAARHGVGAQSVAKPAHNQPFVHERAAQQLGCLLDRHFRMGGRRYNTVA